LQPTQVNGDLLPSDHDVAFFREHGWYRSPKIIPDALLDNALVGAARHFRGERDYTLPIDTGFSNWRPEDGDVIRNGQAVALQNKQIRQLVLHPILGAVAARLTGSDEIRYFDDSVIYKPPQLPGSESVVGWHTDRAYWGSCTSDSMLTAWIPLQDTPEEMGPVEYIDRSNQWPGAEHLRTFHSKDLAALEDRFTGDRLASRHIMDLRRGEVSFHSSLTVHGSGANRGRTPRIALAVHMQDGQNRFRYHLDNDGNPWHLFCDDLARKLEDGSPDYTDPVVFPRLYPLLSS